MFGKLGAGSFITHQHAPFPDVWKTVVVNNEDEYKMYSNMITKNKGLNMRLEWLVMRRLFRDSLPLDQEWWKITCIIATEQSRPDLLRLAQSKMLELQKHLLATPRQIQDTIFILENRREVLEAIPIRTQEQRDEYDYIDFLSEKFYDYLGSTGDPIDYSAAPEFSSFLRRARLAKNKKDYAYFKKESADLPDNVWLDDLELGDD